MHFILFNVLWKPIVRLSVTAFVLGLFFEIYSGPLREKVCAGAKPVSAPLINN